jgi:hypothetical protein
MVGFIAPFLPGFLYAVLTGRNLDLPAGILGLLLLVGRAPRPRARRAPGGPQAQAMSGSR